MPLEGSVRGAPKPSDITKHEVVERLREVNMYFSAIGFISDVKKGPFWEHSPILYDISGIKDGWGKINKGMIKMFNAEVLGKFPVVQHFPFGSLFSWDEDPSAAATGQSIHIANQPTATLPGKLPPLPLVASGTAAPWAPSTKLPPATGGGADIAQMRSPGPSPRAPQPGPDADSKSREARRLEPSLRDEDLKRTLSGGKKGTAGAQFAFTKAPWAK
jgi:serine/threonine-protein phosphatase 2A activator